MKFQAAAMGRADVPEDQREDFSLFVDEFQNFATDSFESILSEARKYRLNLVLGNQFMAQLTDKIREAIIGNVGTVISGRIGTTDAEAMVKRYRPTFEEDDLTKMPNHESIASVMINNMPSAPFSMSWIAPMGQTNPRLSGALKQLSAAKYGRPRAEVEKAIFDRLGAAEREKQDRLKQMKSTAAAGRPTPSAPKPSSSGSSFLDEWLAKRQQLGGQKPPTLSSSNGTAAAPPSNSQPQRAPIADIKPQGSFGAPQMPSSQQSNPFMQSPPDVSQTTLDADEKLHLRTGSGFGPQGSSEVSVKLRK